MTAAIESETVAGVLVDQTDAPEAVPEPEPVHLLHVIDPVNGDKLMRWTPSDTASIEAARLVFEDRIGTRDKPGKGYLAYTRGADGTATQTRTFDPDQPATVVSRPLVGG